MALTIAGDLEEQVQALAGATGRDPQALTEAALRQYLAREERTIARVRLGIEAADRGDVAPHEEVMARLEAKIDAHERRSVQ